MTPEAQRIAIAEACGWKRMPEYDWSTSTKWDATVLHKAWVCDGKGIIPEERLPNYPADLNAMHEAELVFDTNLSQLSIYVLLLDKLQQHGRFATAAQRAEAFLRTIGKWETA